MKKTEKNRDKKKKSEEGRKGGREGGREEVKPWKAFCYMDVHGRENLEEREGKGVEMIKKRREKSQKSENVTKLIHYTLLANA